MSSDELSYPPIDELRECNEGCPHFDRINMCCWQATDEGLCFDVDYGDLCHLGYKRHSGE